MNTAPTLKVESSLELNAEFICKMLKNRQLNTYQNFITMISLENDELEMVVDRLIILVMPPPKMVDAWMNSI